MNRFALACIRVGSLFALLSAFISLTVVSPAVAQDRIIGGNNASPGEYPWASFLQLNYFRDGTYLSSSACGGTLIAPNWVITAAHCMTLQSGVNGLSIDIKVGAWDRTSSDGDIRWATQVIVHPSYNNATNANDLALVKLNAASAKTPAYLPDREVEQAIITGSAVTAVGWGVTSPSILTLPNILQEVELHVANQTTCAAAYARLSPPLPITSSMVCADDPGQDACQGDSGGPLTIRWGNRAYLAGATSFGYGCATPGFPGVYSRISSFRSWIAQSISDTRLPDVKILTPTANPAVSSNYVLSVDADDNIGISKVEFWVEGALVKTFTQAPFDFSLDTFKYANGTRWLTALAYDLHGNIGSASASFVVSNSAPAITRQPTTLTLAEGTSGTFSVAATGTAITIQWEQVKNGVWTTLPGAVGSTYRVTASEALHLNFFRAKISNRIKTIYTETVQLKVVFPIRITSQPVSTTVGLGKTASFTVSAAGTTPTYQWQFRKAGATTWSNIAGATGTTYSFATALTSVGSYQVVIKNLANTVTSAIATLAVVAPPVITLNPAAQTVATGTSVTFKVTASGTGLTYRWQYRKTPTTAWTYVTGGTAASLVVKAGSTTTGEYRALVDNLGGQAISSIAALKLR